VDVLPNNFADFPPGKSWRGADSTKKGIFGRLASAVAVVIVLGGLIGFGAYRWVVGQEDTSPPPPSLETTPLDETSSPPQDVAPSTPADPNSPELVVTGLLGNQPESQNWAGYAATEGDYTSVSATWNVPDIGLASPAGIDAAWVGIGGVRSRDLIQAGTERTVLDNGATQQEAWVELLPRPSETVPLKLGPGDSIRVSIDQQGPETWLIAFTNVTSGQTYQVTKRYASSLSSAEWVEEAPSAGRRRTLPLDNFGTVRFSQASAIRNAQVVTISQSGAHPITMITPAGQALARPSRVGADGESFSVTRTSTPSPRRR
jgi:peptidase A4-like protein